MSRARASSRRRTTSAGGSSATCTTARSSGSSRCASSSSSQRSVRSDGHDAAAELRRLGADVDEALEEVRSLARGIYPAPLADLGLVEGLRAAALRNRTPDDGPRRRRRAPLARDRDRRYFRCLEALQNAVKHAEGATAAVIELHDDGALRLEVRDDGAGFDMSSMNGRDGVGLTNMRDRLAAVGASFSSTPPRGAARA